MSFIAVLFMGTKGAWVNIILIVNAYYMVVCEEGYKLAELKSSKLVQNQIAM